MKQSWQLLRSLLRKNVKQVSAMVEIAVRSNCRGGFNNGRGHSQVKLVGRSWRLLRLFLNYNVEEVSTMVNIVFGEVSIMVEVIFELPY